jgi:hypothetical protein
MNFIELQSKLTALVEKGLFSPTIIQYVKKGISNFYSGDERCCF